MAEVQRKSNEEAESEEENERLLAEQNARANKNIRVV